jgi:hypothetical protein
MAEPLSTPASPPQLPVAEAGFLIDSIITIDETAGTLFELAQAGAIRIEDEDEKPPVVSLIDAELAGYGHQRALLKGLFPLLKAGESRHLFRGRKDNLRMLAAQQAMREALHEQVAARGWYHQMPKTWWRLPVPGLRTAAGRDVTNQLTAFRQRLATAEMAQLGHADLIRYLPWAQTIGLGSRWSELIAAGSTDDDDPMIECRDRGVSARQVPVRPGRLRVRPSYPSRRTETKRRLRQRRHTEHPGSLRSPRRDLHLGRPAPGLW